MGRRGKDQPPRAKSLLDEPGFNMDDILSITPGIRHRTLQQPHYDIEDSIGLWYTRYRRFLKLRGNDPNTFVSMYIKRLEKELGLGD